MKGRGAVFLVSWLTCLVAGVAVGVATGYVVQLLQPPAPEDQGNMAYGLYVLVFALIATNITNYVVAVSVGIWYLRRAGLPLSPYRTRAAIWSAVVCVPITLIPTPLILLNSVFAAAIATFSMKLEPQRSGAPTP